MSGHMPAPWEFWHNEKGGWSIKGQSGEVICELARLYGVTPMAIFFIRKRINWRHI